MSKKTIRILAAEADRERLDPILESLHAQGIRTEESGKAGSGRDGSVLAVLSEAFYSDAEAVENLLGLLGQGVGNVLPLQLDETPIPDTVKNALYSRNIISASGREPAQIASRIISALPKKKNRLPLLLILLGILVLAAVGYLYWRSMEKPAEPAAATAPPTPEPTEVPPELPMGLTMEDLASIEVVMIVGEQAEFYRREDIVKRGSSPQWEEFFYRNYDETGAHFYSKEDGHEYSMTRYEDLSFLDLMPNLHSLYLCGIETDLLPDLDDNPRMRQLMLADCEIPDLDWLAGSSFNSIDILNSTGSIRDFSPLTTCERLYYVHIDLVGTQEADLSGFAPPALEQLWINNGSDLTGELDLSGLAACARLKECRLENDLPITDLSFLSGTLAMEKLFLHQLYRLSDISPVSSLKKMSQLELQDCNSVQDYSPIAECGRLSELMLSKNNEARIRNVSFLASLPYLDNLTLYGLDIPNLDFLKGNNSHRITMSNLDLGGEIGDYSGLGAIQKYSRLCLEPYDSPDPDRILPHIENAVIGTLVLRGFSRVDLSALPRITDELELDRCGIRDLSTMPESWEANRLYLNKCSRLTSLEGLQNQSRIGKGQIGVGNVRIFLCPRLTDWSALSGMSLNSLEIVGGYTLPSFADFHTGRLRIESMEEIADLSFLDEMDASRSCSFELVGLDAVTSLAPLDRFHGVYLAVPPQLAEQAEDLVKAGNFQEYRVEYPEGGWEMDDVEISLLSLDELDTLPDALLRRVNRLHIAGSMLVDPEQYDIWQDWSRGGNTPKLVLHDRVTDEEIPVPAGSGIVTDLSMFDKLTGLMDLELYGQPLTSLDGIQNFQDMQQLRICYCTKLKDASPAFAMPDLRWLSFQGCPISSIQGIQNLNMLEELEIDNTKVADLSPLLECDFSNAMANRGGFRLNLNNTPVKEYSALSAIPAFFRLDINDANPSLFLPYLEGKEIRELNISNTFTKQHRLKEKDANALFADFVRSHPELQRISMPWNQALTDLTTLLELENLEYVRVSNDMKKAISSLEGQTYGFELEID